LNEDDALVIHLSDKPITREVSQGWFPNINHAADEMLPTTVVIAK
jgi:hypothetical protein